MTMACSRMTRMGLALYVVLYGAFSAEAFKTALFPKLWTAVQLGEPLVLSCSVTGCDTGNSIAFVWRGMADTSLGGKVSQLGSQSNLTISAVGFENAQRHVCLASCGATTRQMTTDVEVFSFPRDPVISSTPLVAGSPAVITCELTLAYPSHRFTLTLMKNNQRLEQSEFGNDHDDDDENKRTRTLTLKHKFTPSIKDEGTDVVCLSEMIFDDPDVELDPMEKRSSMTLSVSYSPHNVGIALYHSKTLREGDRLNLACTAQSNPPANITWKKQSGKDLQTLQESTSFILESVELSDSGMYICEARNSVGRNASTIEIMVEGQPRNTNILILPNNVVKEGDNVTISCTTLGAPFPRFTLRRKSGSGVTVLALEEGSYTIHRAREEDSGIYECESANELGTQLANVTLVVQVPPRTTATAIPPSENPSRRSSAIVPSPSFAVQETTREDETGASQSIDVTVQGYTDFDEEIRYINSPKEVVNKTKKVELLLSAQEPLKDAVVGIAVLTCIGVLSLLAIMAAIYFQKQAKAQGSYSLVNTKKAIV